MDILDDIGMSKLLANVFFLKVNYFFKYEWQTFIILKIKNNYFS